MMDIVVPASIGNLGPGFDALSVALQLYLRVRIVEVHPAATDRLDTDFAGPAPAPQGENGIERAYRLARERTGISAPGLRVEVRSDIPIRAGLGSSAAAAIAGLRLFAAVTAMVSTPSTPSTSNTTSTPGTLSPLSNDDMLAMGTELEGHPDNAAACLLGGLVVSCRREDGGVTAHPSPWPPRLRFVVATPDTALATKEARAILPASVPLGDAVFNLQRALLLVRAVDNECYDDLREAVRDRWHQPARSALVPGLREALAIDHPAVLGVCLSGSGPSIVALALETREHEAADVLAGVYRRIQLPATIRILSAHQPIGAGTAPVTMERENTA